MAWKNISKGENYDVNGSILSSNILANYKIINIIDTGSERDIIQYEQYV